MKKRRNIKATSVIAYILFSTLILSVGYAVIRCMMAPSEIAQGEPYEKLKSDYVLMIVQCALGIIVMMLPTFISHKWKIVVPNAIVILYYIFLYCAIYLGEVQNFYYVIPFWDVILHAFSGAMLGALGFILVDLLNNDKKIRVSLSPFFVSVFAFCFALAIGALWEVYEFSFDAILGLNMQKHTLEDGTALVGAKALADTMKDIIVDALAALAVAILGYFTGRKKGSAPQQGSNEPPLEPSRSEPVRE
ncbi:MAG: hypothetical protein IJW40_09490 [Clostridia bacterium]|nr:hypothetical protein [Clostridia bacterium]